MRSLLLKIFLWFWGTVVSTAMAFAALVRVLDLGPESSPTRWHLAWGAALLVSGGICYLLTRTSLIPSSVFAAQPGDSPMAN
jgi:hypothetical protein